MPMATPEWMTEVDGVQPIPADGDDFAYHERPAHKPPLIPAQWVSVTDYHKLVERVEVLERRLEELEGD